MNGTLHIADLGVLRVAGADARSFLQGQLSQDMERLHPDLWLPGGLHNPQGRCIALLRLTQRDQDILAVLPAELLAEVQTRLRRFVLRSKVTLEDVSQEWHVRGSVDESGQALHLVPASDIVADSLTRAQWRLLDIAAGQPQVVRATSERFVAQMLNLDAIDAISFSKGCYTGQEVIARAHYRGRVKRRMQRFVSTGVAMLAAGDARTTPEGRRLQIVDAQQHEDGRCEFLAVAPLADAASADEPATDSASTLLECSALPLPYSLPE